MAGAIGLVVGGGKCCVHMLEGREVSANTSNPLGLLLMLPHLILVVRV